MAQRFVEIYCIRNEILLGETLDTNSHWLSRRLTRLGAHVRRVVQLPSDRDAFVEAYRRFMAREGDLLITVGGLGPTDEDNTLSYVAAAAERPFEICNDALELVQKRYEELLEGEQVDSSRLNELRKKMAYMPRGAQPVANPLGVAPAMLLAKRSGAVLSLPGEPEEMKAVFDGERVTSYLASLMAGCAYSQETLIAEVRDESQLLPAMRHVRQRHPDIFIGAQSFRDEQGLRFRIYLYAFAGIDDEADSGGSPGEKAGAPIGLRNSASGAALSTESMPIIATNEIEDLNDAAAAKVSAKVSEALDELRQELEDEGIEYAAS